MELGDERRKQGGEFVTKRKTTSTELFFPLRQRYALAFETGLAFCFYCEAFWPVSPLISSSCGLTERHWAIGPQVPSFAPTLAPVSPPLCQAKLAPESLFDGDVGKSALEWPEFERAVSEARERRKRV